ncbi:hypothetical protein ABH922_000574 [Rhodococcus sp. 27YEA15]|uniref:DUF952 domain-containing protein n=1 Tax=Rhodococcus sp. 27YEA15 TaxID=3156259 RepID=UPI003C7CF3F2
MSGQRLIHVAIADDWEGCKRFGEYEVSTRGISYDDAGFIRAATADSLPAALDHVFGDLTLPLIVAVLDEDALTAAGVDIEWGTGKPRITGPLPMDSETVVAELPLDRGAEPWRVPDLSGYSVRRSSPTER